MSDGKRVVLKLGFLSGLVLLSLLAGCIERTADPQVDDGDDGSAGERAGTDRPRDTGASGPGNGSGEPERGSEDEDESGNGSAPPPNGTPVNGSQPEWADPNSAAIRPGVQMISSSGQCTSNFVFTDSTGAVYLGFAAHCVADGAADETNPCTDSITPFELGEEIDVQGASKPATLAYTSWGALLAADESDADVCASNDFAVVKLHPDDWSKVSPAMFEWGGPSALASADDVEFGSKVLSYGRSGLRFGTEAANPREGWITGNFGDGWGHDATFVTSGLPGDSGSGVLTGDGRALGILVTLGVGTGGVNNGIANLEHALEYARTHGGPDLTLATWDPLQAGILPGF